MSDYIERQKVKDIRFSGGINHDGFLYVPYKELVDGIKALPSADVVQVRHGRWLPIVSYNNTYKCSECGRLLVDITDGLKMVAKHYPYCHCGAKMDGKGEE